MIEQKQNSLAFGCQLDVFPKYSAKFENEARDRTTIGGLISITSLVLVLFLSANEVRYYTDVILKYRIQVRNENEEDHHHSSPHENMDGANGKINLNIEVEFKKAPCEQVRVVLTDILNFPINPHLSKIACTSTKDKMGSIIQGNFLVNNVRGTVQFSARKENLDIDAMHTIRRFSFGPTYSGQISPLDNYQPVSKSTGSSIGLHTYDIKLIPTEYRLLDGNAFTAYQLSSTHFFHEKKGPDFHRSGVVLMYEPSAIGVLMEEGHRHRSFIHLLLQICSIIGGVFTIAGMMDAVVHRSFKIYRRSN